MEKNIYWVPKNPEGELKPAALIYPAWGKLGEVAEEQFIEDQKKNKFFRECTLVKCKLIEVGNE